MRGITVILIMLVFLLAFLSGCDDEDWKEIICGSPDKDLKMKVMCFMMGASGSGSSNTDAAEEKGECTYDSECEPACDGTFAYQRGCDPKIHKCVNTFGEDCAEMTNKYGIDVIHYVCKDAACLPNYEALLAKKAELNERIAELNKVRPYLIDFRNRADAICKLGTGIDSSVRPIGLPSYDMEEFFSYSTLSVMKGAQYSKTNEELLKYSCDTVTAINSDLSSMNREITDAQSYIADINYYWKNRPR